MGFMTRRNLQRRAAAKVAPRVSEKEEVVKEAKEEIVETVSEDVSRETAPTLSREDVMSMPFFKVKSVAQANGINTDKKKTAELRAEVIEKLGL